MRFRTLFILFSFFVVIKLLLVPFINTPHIIFDESILFIESQHIWHNHSYFTDWWVGAQYPPLYPLLISPAAIFNDVLLSFKTILMLNCLVSTMAIFPAYYLSKEYQLAERERWFIVILVGILPASFIYNYTLMSENLFIPLFLSSVYFLKRVSDADSFRNNLYAGLFISLTVMTKMTGVVLIGVYGIVKLWVFLHEKKVIK